MSTEPAGGRQPERTGLAWYRTAIALLGLGLAAPRLTWSFLDAWSLLPAGVVVAGSCALLVASRRRYLRVHRSLRDDSAVPLPDGRLPLLASGLTLVLAVLAAWVVLAAP
ncbi:MAG: DUF202 domain-containing protein [Propionicimonas sp.]|uniref:DUF202 domain-containing protein n=1 Tax=Propionicimonas sp. TaxID=1955623 RepID=UPI003D0FCDE2